MKNNNIRESHTPPSLRDLWLTPRSIYEWLDGRYKFDMDVCACDRFHHHPNYRTERHDSLDPNTEWGKVNFINPPFSRKAEFIEQAQERPGTHVIIVPSDTSTTWFTNAFMNMKRLTIMQGRISFIDPITLGRVDGNPAGTLIFTFSDVLDTDEIEIKKTTEVGKWYRQQGKTYEYDRSKINA